MGIIDIGWGNAPILFQRQGWALSELLDESLTVHVDKLQAQSHCAAYT